MQPAWSLFIIFVVLVLPVPGAHVANEDDLDDLELQSVPARHLAQAEEPAQHKHPCAGLKAGAPIPGQFVLIFKPEQIDSFEQGIASLQAALSDGQVAAAAAPSAPLPVNIITEFRGSNPNSGGRRRQLLQSIADVGLPIGFAFTGTDEAAKTLQEVDSVQYVAPDQCVKLMTDEVAADEAAAEQETVSAAAAAAPSTSGYSCLPAAQVSGITVKPADGASWPGCLSSGIKLAWWGERCGPSNSQILWMGVYAYEARSGKRLSNCVKLRPSTGAAPDDIKYWLGTGCGAVPAALPSMPAWVCTNEFPDTSCQSTSATPGTCPNTYCIPSGADVQQTVEIMHPVSTCSPRKPVKMKFVGERCYGAATSGSAPASIRWLSATPTEAVTNPDTCSMYRQAGTGTDKAVYNQNYFGSCGVPPARIQYLAWGECPVPPPPSPPPPAPPPPRNMGQLPREPVGLGSQTVPAGVRRILAVTQQDDGSLQTVRQLYVSRVAVMDTGVDCNHADLNVYLALCFNNEQPKPGQDPGCYDGYGHGTHVSGIIGAINNRIGVLGVLPNTPIVSLKVLDANGDGSFSDILKAVDWLMATSFNSTTEQNPGNVTNAELYNINVLSMSLGYGSKAVSYWNSRTMCQALQTLVNGGVVVVAAASNEKSPLNNVGPANCPAVVAVTSLNQQDGTVSAQQSVSWFSNYLWLRANDSGILPPTPEKERMTIAGPGTQINSTCSTNNPNGRTGYCTLSGTSQATPHIAGIYARCFSSGRCSDSKGALNIQVAIDEFVTYNTEINTDFGYQQDPIRSPNTDCATNIQQCKYYGYLAWADSTWVDAR